MSIFQRLIVAAAIVIGSASAAHGLALPGSNFDGIMSLIYDNNTGNVFIENSPLLNPAIEQLLIVSNGGLLLPGNLNLPSPTPPVTVTSATPSLINISWSNGNFLGTGSFLGNILNPAIPLPTLSLDLTIEYIENGHPVATGDLIYGSFGQLQSQPVLPTGPLPGNGFFRFFDVNSGQFFDPPMAYGYLYEMTSDSLFTKVGLPLELGNDFTITSSEGTVSGLPEGGQHIFTSGVSSFTITGLDPLADPTDEAAFPVYLEFSTPEASFSMTALTIPEPATLTMVGLCSMIAFGIFRRKK